MSEGVCVCVLDTRAYCRDEKNMASESYRLKKIYIDINIKAPAMRSKNPGVSSVLHK